MSNQSRSGWDTFKDVVMTLNVIATVIIGILVYLHQSAHSDLRVDFNGKDHPEYAPMLSPNSQRGFNPSTTPAYLPPSTTRIYEIIIRNESDIKASDVTAEIKLKAPFVICLVSFDETLQPKGTWEVKYNEDTYDYCKIGLGLIGSKNQADKTRFLLVYSYPAKLDVGDKTKEANALTIKVDSPSQRDTVEASFSLDYWGK
ncbi:MAG: hypothetical protein ACFFCW_07890 [Candidatus Hodarchaeota archaeon]